MFLLNLNLLSLASLLHSTLVHSSGLITIYTRIASHSNYFWLAWIKLLCLRLPLQEFQELHKHVTFAGFTVHLNQDNCWTNHTLGLPMWSSLLSTPCYVYNNYLWSLTSWVSPMWVSKLSFSLLQYLTCYRDNITFTRTAQSSLLVGWG